MVTAFRRGYQMRGALVFRFQLSLRDIEELLFERGIMRASHIRVKATWRVLVKGCSRINNRAENSHQPTRKHEQHMPWLPRS
jgi:transposase-like protein